MSPRRIIRKKIGELLIERNVITEEQLKTALQEQSSKGGYVSQHLISLGFVTEFDVANCLSSQYGFAYIPLKSYTISQNILDMVPLKFIKIYSILPVDKMGDVLTVAMADPLNDGVIEMLRQITNRDIEVMISTYGEISRAIEKYFGKKLKGSREFALGEEEMFKENITQQFIQTIAYNGVTRRRYKRIDTQLHMSYFWQSNIFEAMTSNISYIGVLFICNSFIPIDTNVSCRIYLDETSVDALVQVARVERIRETRQVDSYEVSIWNYGVAGFFSFMDDTDRKKLAAFLKQKLS
jgi:hypothetical protein